MTIACYPARDGITAANRISSLTAGRWGLGNGYALPVAV